MDSVVPTPPVSSTTAVPESCISTQAPASPFQLLEISLISAQDLSPISKAMQTYAIAWVDPSRKHTTRTDQRGHKNPTWNDKFVLPLDNVRVSSENVILTVEIYTVSWFRDVLVGSVKVLIGDLVNPLTRTRRNGVKNTRFVALQVRRPSGNPQGILNLGVALLENTMRSMPLSIFPRGNNFEENIVGKGENEKLQVDDHDYHNNAKIHLWRSLSVGSSEITTNNDDFPIKPGSIHNENGSELCSDIGPSASIVAAKLARKHQPPPGRNPSNPRKHDDHHETGSSIVEDLTMEEAKAKGYRTSRQKWRKDNNEVDHNDDDDDDESELLWRDINGRRRSSRRNSDGGLFSCFGNAYGIEVRIVCGASKNARGSKNGSGGGNRRKIKGSENSSA